MNSINKCCNYFIKVKSFSDLMYEQTLNGTDINKSCIFEPSPSETNDKCKEFKQIMGAHKMPKPGEAIVIELGRNITTRCYGSSKSGAGWCGACINHARRGLFEVIF